MKNKIIFFLLLLFSVNLFSQRLSKEERQAILDAKKAGIERPNLERDSLTMKDANYLEILGYGRFLSRKVTVSLDFGQKSKFILRDKKGEIIVFNSMIDAMNYFSQRGWKFIQAYAVTVNNSNVYHYLMERINPVSMIKDENK